ncbi:MAG TPA: HNH endonuclease signature motif containing protein [Acidobacteriaceae bacterium]|nr:HNH endonuclease signature motif containing protein [Acidobacteriaceae bacterium]
MTAQQRYDEQKRILRDVTTSDQETLQRIKLLSAFRGTLTEFRELLRARRTNGITDRAKRYRAQRNKPAGPRRCNFCASRRNVDVDHITGNESDEEPENLMYLCRVCNTRKGLTQARNRIGVRTRQYNPQRAPGFVEFRNAALVLVGAEPGDVGVATALVRATPPDQRRKYAERIAAGMKNPDPDFRQYARAVAIHQRGAHDEGGAIIHATPPALRSRYAARIAAIKRQRRESVPF